MLLLYCTVSNRSNVKIKQWIIVNNNKNKRIILLLSKLYLKFLIWRIYCVLPFREFILFVVCKRKLMPLYREKEGRMCFIDNLAIRRDQSTRIVSLLWWKLEAKQCNIGLRAIQILKILKRISCWIWTITIKSWFNQKSISLRFLSKILVTIDAILLWSSI